MVPGGRGPRDTTQVLTNLKYVALARGEVEQARAIFTESLTFGREHSDQFNTPAWVRGVAALADAAGESSGADRLLAAADELFAVTGATRWRAERLGGPMTMDTLREPQRGDGRRGDGNRQRTPIQSRQR